MSTIMSKEDRHVTCLAQCRCWTCIVSTRFGNKKWNGHVSRENFYNINKTHFILALISSYCIIYVYHLTPVLLKMHRF